jgi:4-oxalocrotonate tautomerase
VVEWITSTIEGDAMPLVNVRVIEQVLSAEQKQEIAKQFTETFASVVGEPVRELTWVIIDDIGSGALTMGGNPVTTDAVKGMLEGAPAGV